MNQCHKCMYSDIYLRSRHKMKSFNVSVFKILTIQKGHDRKIDGHPNPLRPSTTVFNIGRHFCRAKSFIDISSLGCDRHHQSFIYNKNNK